MKITNLTINKLHGHLDYSVQFNDDITFLYGDNGCGKTTILNIITYIITGKIYELFQYQFNEIILSYVSSQTQKEDQIIIVNDKENILVSFNDENIKIDFQKLEYMSRNADETEEVERFYFSEYPLLKNIREVFNYIYLPLNRNGNVIVDYRNNMRNRKIIQARHSIRHRMGNDFDYNLIGVESLISSAYSRVNFTLNQISEHFGDEILKTFLDVDNISTLPLAIEYMKRLDKNTIVKIQKDYTAVVKTMLKWDDETEAKINLFFDSLIEEIQTAQSPLNDVNTEDFMALMFKLSELTKITNVIYKAEKTEQSKKRVRQPIEDFLNTVNGFIQSNSTNKEIAINNEGVLYLKTPQGNKIDIQSLSSGEKQIITFFAYLVFGLPTTNQSIFIVDEPELSLHLNWQRKFVDSIVAINKNVQLIFATHAPEMIGKHRDKAVKLVPNP